MRRLFVSLLLLLGLLLSSASEAALTITSARKWTTGTASSGTWLEIVLPANTAYVIVKVDGAAWVDGPGGGWTDGAARSSGGLAITSTDTVSMPIVTGAAKSIFVAGNGGSRTVSVQTFGTEAQ